MKEYLLVSKSDAAADAAWNTKSAEDWKAVGAEFSHWIKGMEEKGLWLRGDSLSSQRRRISVGAARVVDGPFAETKEMMSGFFLFKAENIEQATEIAKSCPTLLHDSLELIELNGER